jgi:hypothetical protein
MRAREKTAVNSATLILKETVKQKTKTKKHLPTTTTTTSLPP